MQGLIKLIRLLDLLN